MRDKSGIKSDVGTWLAVRGSSPARVDGLVFLHAGNVSNQTALCAGQIPCIFFSILWHTIQAKPFPSPTPDVVLPVSRVVGVARAKEGLAICFVHARTHSLTHSLLNVKRDLGQGSQTHLHTFKRTTLNISFLTLASTAFDARISALMTIHSNVISTTRRCLCGQGLQVRVSKHATLDSCQLCKTVFTQPNIFLNRVLRGGVAVSVWWQSQRKVSLLRFSTLFKACVRFYLCSTHLQQAKLPSIEHINELDNQPTPTKKVALPTPLTQQHKWHPK